MIRAVIKLCRGVFSRKVAGHELKKFSCACCVEVISKRWVSDHLYCKRWLLATKDSPGH